MNKLLEEIPIKTEPRDFTSINQIEKQIEVVKEDKECSTHTEFDVKYMKTEPDEDESVYSFRECTSYEMCYDYVETDEAIIKIEYDDLGNNVMHDPLDISNENEVVRNVKNELYNEKNHKSEPEEFKGEECHSQIDEKLSDENGKQQNVKNKLVNKIKKYDCHVCNKSFTCKFILNNHLRVHTGEKPFICSICGTSFAEKGNLTKHMLTHNGEKPYVCDICKQEFTTKPNLVRHKLIHKGVKFSCDECNKSFAQKHNLSVHKRKHSGNFLNCNVCDKTFTTKSNFNDHIRIHTKEMKYSCDVCGREFIQKNNLIRHKRVHTGDKPYTCTVCNRSFAQKHNLVVHKQKHWKHSQF